MRRYRAVRPFGAVASSPQRRATLTGALLLLLVLPTLLTAQTINGVVSEQYTGTPLADVEIHFRNAGGQRVGPALRTDPDGRFGMRMHDPGVYTLFVRRVGYVPTVQPDIRVGRRAEVQVVVVLEIQPTRLEELRVTERPNQRPFYLEGFEHRRRMGLGTFFTREDIQKVGTASLSNMIRGMTHVNVTSRGGRASATTSPSSMGGAVCNVVLFVDGVQASSPFDSPATVFRNFEMIPAQHIEAVEVYRGRSQLPAEFGGPDVRCGAIVVWTRRPGIRQKGDG